MKYEDLSIHNFSQDMQKFLKKELSKGLIFGNFGACNLGDEAILAGQLAELSYLENTTITVVTRYPKNVTALHKVKAIQLLDFFSTLSSVLHADYIIYGGGGLFCKNDTGIRGFLFQLYQTSLFLLLPGFLKKNVFVIGIGFYSNTNAFITWLAVKALKSAHIIGVRDHSSSEFLKEQGLKITEYKDNSYLMPLTLPDAKKTSKKRIIGFALNRPHTNAESEKLISEITKFIVKHHKGVTFRFYALDYHPLYNNDKKYAQKIIKQVKKSIDFEFEFYPMQQHPEVVFGSFTDCDFMITSRLHGSLFSYRLHVPFFGISYDRKCESFLRSIDHQLSYPDSLTEVELTANYELQMEKGK